MKRIMTLADVNDLVKKLKTIQTMIEYMPENEVDVCLESGDNRLLGSINLSDEILNLKDSLKYVFEKLGDDMDDIYKNAIDEREGYSVNSMAKRALWLDEVCIATDCVLGEINNR